MSRPDSHERRIVPPMLPQEGRPSVTYTPPKYVPPGYDQRRRNLLVWALCAVIILMAVIVFVNLMLPNEMRELLRYTR